MSGKLKRHRDELLVAIKQAYEYPVCDRSQTLRCPPPTPSFPRLYTRCSLIPNERLKAPIPLVRYRDVADQGGHVIRNCWKSPCPRWFLSCDDYLLAYDYMARTYRDSMARETSLTPDFIRSHPLEDSPCSPCSLQAVGDDRDVTMDILDVLELSSVEVFLASLGPTEPYSEAENPPSTEDERILEMILDMEDDYSQKYQVLPINGLCFIRVNRTISGS